MLIKDLAATWLERLKHRKRKPIKPASLAAFSSYVVNHVNPLIGELEVETFQNKQMRFYATAVPSLRFTNLPPILANRFPLFAKTG
jgi:hypothetical protein